MMAISIASTLGALRLRRSLMPRHGNWNGSLMALAAYLVVMAAVFTGLPSINEVPAAFHAVTLWDFRVASFGIQTVSWGSIGILFGYVSTWGLK